MIFIHLEIIVEEKLYLLRNYSWRKLIYKKIYAIWCHHLTQPRHLNPTFIIYNIIIWYDLGSNFFFHIYIYNSQILKNGVTPNFKKAENNHELLSSSNHHYYLKNIRFHGSAFDYVLLRVSQAASPNVCIVWRINSDI